MLMLLAKFEFDGWFHFFQKQGIIIKIGFPLKPYDVIVMSSNVHEWNSCVGSGTISSGLVTGGGLSVCCGSGTCRFWIGCFWAFSLVWCSTLAILVFECQHLEKSLPVSLVLMFLFCFPLRHLPLL